MCLLTVPKIPIYIQTQILKHNEMISTCKMNVYCVVSCCTFALC